MDLGRAAKYGSASALGVVLISLGTSGLMGTVWNDRLSGAEGMAIANIIMIGILGMALAIVFLFVVIGAFLDRELEARGLSDPEE
jgi:uncharacterized protein YybS (DUF2232 family)